MKSSAICLFHALSQYHGILTGTCKLIQIGLDPHMGHYDTAPTEKTHKLCSKNPCSQFFCLFCICKTDETYPNITHSRSRTSTYTRGLCTVSLIATLICVHPYCNSVISLSLSYHITSHHAINSSFFINLSDEGGVYVRC